VSENVEITLAASYAAMVVTVSHPPGLPSVIVEKKCSIDCDEQVVKQRGVGEGRVDLSQHVVIHCVGAKMFNTYAEVKVVYQRWGEGQKETVLVSDSEKKRMKAGTLRLQR